MTDTIRLHALAPPKPALGAPCNGCGVCCAAEPCPLGQIFFLRRRGACPALDWDSAASRYACGLVVRPAHHLRWLPAAWSGPAGRWFSRRIAAGIGCDADMVILPEA
jgi:hypothetical protein